MMTQRHAQPAVLLGEVVGLRASTRSVLQHFWFPLVLFGVLTLVTAPYSAVVDGAGIAVYWAVAGPAGGIATALYYRRRELQLGVGRPAWPYAVVATTLVAGTFLLPAFVGGDAQEVVSVYAVAAGYLGFAYLERSVGLLGLATFLAVVPTVVLAADVGAAYAVTATVTGMATTGTGLAYRHSSAS